VTCDDRRGHAVLDLSSRTLKAKKIERLLGDAIRRPSLRMLEIGTGSGGIARYFGTSAVFPMDVDAVDVRDERVVRDGYRFQTVDGVALPFADATFDVVVTNHVIEHVGDRAAQLAHLREVRRVMKPNGIGYLAVPNRWMLVEPHYRLAFLSWLPHAWRTPYLRLLRNGEWYDCEPFALHEIESHCRAAGLSPDNVCVEALTVTLELEHPARLRWARSLARMPAVVRRAFERACPTLVYLLRPVATE
jgi:SAM-dependent methyltransferase